MTSCHAVVWQRQTARTYALSMGQSRAIPVAEFGCADDCSWIQESTAFTLLVSGSRFEALTSVAV